MGDGKTSERHRLSFSLGRHANFVHVPQLKVFKLWNMKRTVSILGYEQKGANLGTWRSPLVFVCDIKERFPPYVHVSVGEEVWNVFRLRRVPSQPFHLDVLETNDCFSAFFRKFKFHITARQTPTWRRNKARFFKINARCFANARQPFSQSVSQSVNQFGKERQGPRVETPVHITS